MVQEPDLRAVLGGQFKSLRNVVFCSKKHVISDQSARGTGFMASLNTTHFKICAIRVVKVSGINELSGIS